MEKVKKVKIIYDLVDKKIISKNEIEQYSQGLLNINVVKIPMEKCINISKLRYNLAVEKKYQTKNSYSKLIEALSKIVVSDNDVYIVSFCYDKIIKTLYINDDLTRVLYAFTYPT